MYTESTYLTSLWSRPDTTGIKVWWAVLKDSHRYAEGINLAGSPDNNEQQKIHVSIHIPIFTCPYHSSSMFSC